MLEILCVSLVLGGRNGYRCSTEGRVGGQGSTDPCHLSCIYIYALPEVVLPTADLNYLATDHRMTTGHTPSLQNTPNPRLLNLHKAVHSLKRTWGINKVLLKSPHLGLSVIAADGGGGQFQLLNLTRLWPAKVLLALCAGIDIGVRDMPAETPKFTHHW